MSAPDDQQPVTSPGAGDADKTPVPEADPAPVAPPPQRPPRAASPIADNGEEAVDDWDKALATWEHTFEKKVGDDVGHKPVAPVAPVAPPVAAAAPKHEPDPFADLFGSDSEIDFKGEGEALGTLLGEEPPPLAPPEPDEPGPAKDEAARSTGSSRRLTIPPVAASASAASELPPAPTDDEIFGGLGELGELEEAEWEDEAAKSTLSSQPGEELLSQVRGGPRLAPEPEEVAIEALPEPSADSTRLAGPEMAQLVKASGAKEPAPPQPTPTPTPAPSKPAPPPMTAPVSHADFGDEPAGAEATRIAGPELEDLVQRSALEKPTPVQAEPAFPEPAARSFTLDESAYDDIEVTSAEEVPTPPPPAPSEAFNFNVNIARRPDAPPLERAAAPAVTLELEMDEPEPTTTMMRREALSGPPSARLQSESPWSESGRIATPVAPAPPVVALGSDITVVGRPSALEPEADVVSSSPRPRDLMQGSGPVKAAPAATPSPVADVLASLEEEQPTSIMAKPDLAAGEDLVEHLPVDAPASEERTLVQRREDILGPPDTEPTAVYRAEIPSPRRVVEPGTKSDDQKTGVFQPSARSDDQKTGVFRELGQDDQKTRVFRLRQPSMLPPVAASATAEGPDLTSFTPPAIDVGAFNLPDTQEPGIEDPGVLAELGQAFQRELDNVAGEDRARLGWAAGRLAERSGDPDRARTLYESALDAIPGHLPAVRGLRRLLVRAGEIQGALPLLEEERNLSTPEERRIIDAYRADLLLAMGEQDLARLVVGDLLDAAPDDRAGLLAALELAYADRRDDELEPLLSRLAARTTDPALSAALEAVRARLLERRGSDEAAGSAYQAALALAPGDVGARLGLARVAGRAQREAEAALGWVEACQHGQLSAPLRAAALRRAALHQAGAAQARLASGSGGADTLALQGAARAAAQAAIDATPGDALCEELVANLAPPEQAAAALSRWAAVEADPALKIEALDRLAGVRHAAGDAAGATAALREAQAVDPRSPVVARALARVVAASGDAEAHAGMALDRIEQDAARSLWHRVAAARRVAALGRHDEATRLLDQAAADPALPRVVHRELARLYAALGQTGEAARAMARAGQGESDPAIAVALHEQAAELAELAAHQARLAGSPDAGDRQAAAEAAWAKVLDDLPGSAAASGGLLRLAAASGNLALLAERLDGAATGASNRARAAGLAVRRAQLLEQGDGALAAEAAAAALAFDPTDPRAFALAVRLAMRAGRWEDLARLYETRAGELPPGAERSAVRYRAAEVTSTELGDPRRGADLLSEVVTRLPGFAFASDLLARLYRRAGDPGGLARALEPPPAAQVPLGMSARFIRLVRLAEVLEDQAADPGRAVARYREALELYPSDPFAVGGYQRACARAGETGALSEIALGRLREAGEDPHAKVLAYEELARIDGDLRSDPSSALLAYQSIAELEPGRVLALRALERAYVGDPERAADTISVYQKLAAAVTDPRDAEAIGLERARLCEATGAEPGDVLDAYRAVLDRAPASRPALLRLESQARLVEDARQLGDLADRLADAYGDDRRARAAFLTRGGEARADAGDGETAAARLREANIVVDNHLPALRALEHLGLTSGRFDDAVFAGERLGQSVNVPAERVRALLTAAAVAEDRLGEGDRAAAVLAPLLALEPGHVEAFVRLRGLYQRGGRHGELAALLEARAQREPEIAHKLELHQSLAALYRELGDRARAKAELRHILEIAPGDLDSLGALSELAWEDNEYAEAADLLIRRARLEKEPLTLKGIFVRLGVLYDERLPDPARAAVSFQRAIQLDPEDELALERLSLIHMRQGDWSSALQITDHLVKLDRDGNKPVDKWILHMQRIAQIYEEGLGDPRHAEETLRRTVEAQPTDLRAILALTEFYQRRRDTMALRVHLDRSAGAMRARLGRDPFDVAAYRVLHRVLDWRGAPAASTHAAEALVIMGAAAADEQAAAEAARAAPPPTIATLGDPAIDDILFHRALPSGFRHVFRLLGPILAKRYGSDLRRYGVGKNDRLVRSGSGPREIAAQIATQLGLGDAEVYISAAQPGVLAVEPGSPPQIIIGAALVEGADGAELRFVIARALKLYVSHCALPARLSTEELGVLVAAVVRQYSPEFAPASLPAAALNEETQRLARLVPRNLRGELTPYALECMQVAMEPAAMAQAVAHTGNRAGLLAAASLDAGVSVLCRRLGISAAERAGAGFLGRLRGQLEIEELMRFSVSEEQLELHRQLG